MEGTSKEFQSETKSVITSLSEDYQVRLEERRAMETKEELKRIQSMMNVSPIQSLHASYMLFYWVLFCATGWEAETQAWQEARKEPFLQEKDWAIMEGA